MYALVKCGGRQYKVCEGDVLNVELLGAEHGTTVELDKVLMLADGENITVGKPFVEGAKVSAEVIDTVRGEKIKIVKFRRRKHHQKVTGHRQSYNSIKITGISA